MEGGASRVATGPVPVIGRLQHWQRSRYALFRGPPDPLPRGVRQLLRPGGRGLNGDLAQKLAVNLPTEIWVVPGDRTLCLVDWQRGRYVGTTCSTRGSAYGHGVMTTFLAPARGSAGGAERTVVGVAPDGARTAFIHTTGTTATAPIADNVFVRQDSISTPPDSVTF